MKKAGRIPTDEERMQPFWIFMMDYAEDKKEVATFEEALKALKEKFGGNPQAAKFFEQKEEILKKLKEGAKK